MVLQLHDLQELFGPPIEGSGEAAALADSPAAAQDCLRICTDSRHLEVGDGFVALVGERFDGHRFVADAITQGARAVVFEPARLQDAAGIGLQQLQQRATEQGCLLWGVNDGLDAYQQLGQRARQRLQVPVIAVTGSAGKTTTRELIRAVLAPLGPIWASRGNENNDIGVPLTLLGAGPEHRAVVVEMGMRGLGEIERLSRCSEPDVAVITNIGTAHIGRLGSRDAIATAKCEITSALRPDGVVVIPAGDPLLDHALARVWNGRVVRVALSGDALAYGSAAANFSAELENEQRGANAIQGDARHGSHGTLKLTDGSIVPLPLAGRHNARNLLLALAVAQQLGVDPAALSSLAVEMPGGRNRRLQLGGLTLLDETYNASPEAVLAALELLAAHPGRRFAVLGTMLELGEQSLAQHRRVAERAAELNLDGLVIVDAGAEGQVMAEAARSLPQLAVVASPQQAAESLQSWLRCGDAVLLKASRGVALERLIPLLPELTS